MKISKELTKELNNQIIAEMYSANMYQAMSIHTAMEGLDGFTHWLRLQANEEMEHAWRIIDYMISRGVKPEVGKIDAVKGDWGAPLQLFEAVYAHEVEISNMINKLMGIAQKDNDYATQDMLWWFVREQVEEENTPAGIIDKIKTYGPSGLGGVDQLLYKREDEEEDEE